MACKADWMKKEGFFDNISFDALLSNQNKIKINCTLSQQGGYYEILC